MDTGSGRSNLVHAGHQNRSSVIAQKARLQAASTEAGIHPEEQRQDASARGSDDKRPRDAGAPSARAGTNPGMDGGPPTPRDSDDKRPRDAGAPSARAGTNRGMYGGPQLLRIPDETLGPGCDDGMSNP